MKDNHGAVLLEDIQSKLGGSADRISAVRQDIAGLKQAVVPIPQMADDIKAMKVAIKDLSLSQNRVERRVTALEMPQRA